MSEQRLVAACTDEHFRAMSLIHALGWRTTYRGFVPDDYLRDVITDTFWVDYFRQDHETGRCRGLLLYDGDKPVSCCNFGPARETGGSYTGWGELVSFYTHPEEKGKGCGSAVMAAALDGLRAAGYRRCYVFVLRENAQGRGFYEKHGFHWDGTQIDIPFPHGAVCVDLRYVREL